MGEWDIVSEMPSENPNEWAVVSEIPVSRPTGAGRSYEDETPLSVNRLNEDLVKRASYIADTLTPKGDESLYDTMKKAPFQALKIVGKGAAGLVNDVGMQVAESAYKTFVPESWQKNISEWGKELLDTPPVNPEESLGQSIDYAPGRLVKTGVEGYGAFKKAFPEGAEIAESVGNIAMAAPMLKGIGKYAEVVGEAGKVAGKSGYNLVADTVAAATRRTPEAIEAALDEAISKGINKGIRPTVAGKANIGQIENYMDRAKTAVKEIIGNKDSLVLTDVDGNVVKGILPQSLKQFSEAIDQTKKGIFRQYDDLTKAAGEKGVGVDLGPAIKELEDIAGKTTLQDLNPEIVKYAQTRAAALTERGVYTTSEAQDAITQLNKSLEAFYKNPSYENATRAGIDAVIANNLRKSLDAVIESATGGGYQALKNSYGALKTIEKEVAHRAVVDARKNLKGLVDFTDIYTSGELIAGLATMSPGMIVKGVTWKGVQQYIKMMNNPNRIVKNMFGDAESIINSGKPRKSVYGPTGPAEGPPPDLYPEQGMNPGDILETPPPRPNLSGPLTAPETATPGIVPEIPPGLPPSPPEIAKPVATSGGRQALPDWLREELERRGWDKRKLNDVDLRNESVRKALDLESPERLAEEGIIKRSDGTYFYEDKSRKSPSVLKSPEVGAGGGPANILNDMMGAFNESAGALRKEISNVRYGMLKEGKPGEILFDFRGKTYTAPEPSEVMPVGHGEASNNWALQQLLDKKATPIGKAATGKGQYEVTVRENIVVGGRKTAEPVEKVLTVTANSPAAARKAIVDSGQSGKIIDISKKDMTPTQGMTFREAQDLFKKYK